MNAYSKSVAALLFAALCSTTAHAQTTAPAQAEYDSCAISDSIFQATALRYIEFAVDKKGEMLNRPLGSENGGLEEFVRDLGIFAEMSQKLEDAREHGSEVLRGSGILHDADAFMKSRFTRAENDSLINELRKLSDSTRLNASQKKELDDKAVELEYTELAVYDLYDIHTEVSKITNDPVYAPGSESAMLEDVDALIESLKDKTDNVGKYPYLKSVLDAYLKAIHTNPRAIDPQIISLIEGLNDQYTDYDDVEAEEAPAESQEAESNDEVGPDGEIEPAATAEAEKAEADESNLETEIIEDVIDEAISENEPATAQPSATAAVQQEPTDGTDEDNIIDTRYTD